MTSVIDKEMTLLLDTVEKAENKYSTKFRLPVLNNKVQCNIFNKDKEIIDISELNEKDFDL